MIVGYENMSRKQFQNLLMSFPLAVSQIHQGIISATLTVKRLCVDPIDQQLSGFIHL